MEMEQEWKKKQTIKFKKANLQEEEKIQMQKKHERALSWLQYMRAHIV